MSPQLAAQHMGWSGLNGRSRVTLSALKKFGLLVDAPEQQVRLSDDAIAVIVSPGGPRTDATLVELARRPDIFREIAGAFPDGLPSNENLRAQLILRWEFTETGASGLIKSLRDTHAIAPGAFDDFNDIVDEEPGDSPRSALAAQQREHTPARSPVPSTTAPALPFVQRWAIGDQVIELRASGVLRRRDYRLIAKYLEVAAEGAPDETGSIQDD